ADADEPPAPPAETAEPPAPPADAPAAPPAPEEDRGAAVLAHEAGPADGVVTAPTGAPAHWAPHRPTSTDAPEFTAILHPADDAAGNEPRHPRLTDTIAGVATTATGKARTAASSVAERTKRVAEETTALTDTARKSLDSAIAAGKSVLGTPEDRRPTPDEDLFPEHTPPADIDGPEVPFKERRIDPTPVVLAVVGALVFVLLVVALKTFFAPASPVALPHVTDAPTTAAASPTPSATPSASPSPSPTPTTPPPAPVIQSLAPVDPQGDGAENPQLTLLAMDGDPATYWRSRSYKSPTYGMKDGIGLVVTLPQATEVSKVEIDLHGNGGQVQIRSTTAQAPTQGEILAEGPMGPDSVFTFAKPVKTASLVLWFPQLPVAESDGKNRIELAELRLG
ncbi:hypothetical protein, partial [Georgenia thermotolerans]